MDEDDAEELIDELLELPEDVIRQRLAGLDAEAKGAVMTTLLLRVAAKDGTDVAMGLIEEGLRKLQPH